MSDQEVGAGETNIIRESRRSIREILVVDGLKEIAGVGVVSGELVL